MKINKVKFINSKNIYNDDYFITASEDNTANAVAISNIDIVNLVDYETKSKTTEKSNSLNLQKYFCNKFFNNKDRINSKSNP